MGRVGDEVGGEVDAAGLGVSEQGRGEEGNGE